MFVCFLSEWDVQINIDVSCLCGFPASGLCIKLTTPWLQLCIEHIDMIDWCLSFSANFEKANKRIFQNVQLLLSMVPGWFWAVSIGTVGPENLEELRQGSFLSFTWHDQRTDAALVLITEHPSCEQLMTPWSSNSVWVSLLTERKNKFSKKELFAKKVIVWCNLLIGQRWETWANWHCQVKWIHSYREVEFSLPLNTYCSKTPFVCIQKPQKMLIDFSSLFVMTVLNSIPLNVGPVKFETPCIIIMRKNIFKMPIIASSQFWEF